MKNKVLIPSTSSQLIVSLVITLTLTLATSLQARQAVKIENVDLVPENESQTSAGVRFEQERTVLDNGNTSIEFDNTRYQPIQMRMGVLDNMELRLEANFSSNSANTPGGPDQSGLEGIELGGKLQWHPNIATTVTAKFNGSDEVHPYGQDNSSFSANIPIKFQMGNGMFHGEAGITLQSGDAFLNDNRIGKWEDYINYGIGYAYDMNRFAEMSIEIVGHTATVDVDDAENHLELIFGNGIRIGQGTRFKPSVGFALMDGSPNTSFGFDVQVAMGNRRLPRTEDALRKKERFSGRSPVGGVTDPEAVVSEKPPRSESKKKQRRKQEQSETPGMNNVDELMRRAYEAAQDGNSEKALNLYQKAYEMEPNNVLVLSNLGSLHYRNENYRKAIEFYRQAVEEDPEDTFSLLYLGASHYQLGNRQAAQRYFEEVRNLDPNNRRAQKWLDKVNN